MLERKESVNLLLHLCLGRLEAVSVARRKALQSSRSAHIQKALHCIETPISTGHSAVLYRFVSIFGAQLCIWNWFVHLSLWRVKPPASCIYSYCLMYCILHVFISSTMFHFPIISLLLHPSSPACSVPVPLALLSSIHISLFLLPLPYTTYSVFRAVGTAAEFLFFLLWVWSDGDSRRAFLCLPQASNTFSFSRRLSLSLLPHFSLSHLDSFTVCSSIVRSLSVSYLHPYSILVSLDSLLVLLKSGKGWTYTSTITEEKKTGNRKQTVRPLPLIAMANSMNTGKPLLFFPTTSLYIIDHHHPHLAATALTWGRGKGRWRGRGVSVSLS